MFVAHKIKNKCVCEKTRFGAGDIAREDRRKKNIKKSGNFWKKVLTFGVFCVNIKTYWIRYKIN